jgi:hypothetical protein
MKKKISKKDFSKFFNQKLDKTFVEEINRALVKKKKLS